MGENESTHYVKYSGLFTNKNYLSFYYNAPATAQINPNLPAATTADTFGQPLTYGFEVNINSDMAVLP